MNELAEQLIRHLSSEVRKPIPSIRCLCVCVCQLRTFLGPGWGKWGSGKPVDARLGALAKGRRGVSLGAHTEHTPHLQGGSILKISTKKIARRTLTSFFGSYIANGRSIDPLLKSKTVWIQRRPIKVLK